jgi:hypothetical protein
MGHRFSIARVFGDLGRMLKTQWAGLLLVILLFGLGRLALEAALNALPEQSRLRTLRDHRMLQAALESLFWTAFMALFAGAVLHAGLVGVDWRNRRGPLAPFRAMLLGFPAIFLARMLAALPGLISAAIIASIFAAAAEPLRTLAAKAMALNLAASLAGLLIFIFVGSAPAAAISESLDPILALRRSFRLARGRGPLLFVIYLLATLPVGVLTVAIVMMFSGAFPELASHLAILGPSTRSVALIGLNVVSQALLILGAAAVYRELRRLEDLVPTHGGPGEAGAVQVT